MIDWEDIRDFFVIVLVLGVLGLFIYFTWGWWWVAIAVLLGSVLLVTMLIHEWRSGHYALFVIWLWLVGVGNTLAAYLSNGSAIRHVLILVVPAAILYLVAWRRNEFRERIES